MADELNVELLAETENFMITSSEDPEEGELFHVDLGQVTLNLYREEWDEFVELVRQASRKLEK